MLALALAVLLAGSWIYCVLVILAARRYLAVRPPKLAAPAPISILKPLHGADEGLKQNLRTFFEQDYGDFEILFAVEETSDAAVPIVEELRAEYPGVSTRLIITGEPLYASAKVYSLDQMLRVARHDLLVMSDSDTRVTPQMLRTVAAEFQDPNLGVATCPYRAVAGRSFWSRLEAIGMNTEFLAGLVVARMLEGVKFAVGPTIAARREAIDKIGGFNRLKDYHADDFAMGQFAAQAGFGVILSSYIIEHRIGSESLGDNFAHRLRWSRSTRRSRPIGYVGHLFTNPLPLAVFLCALAPQWWLLLVLSALLRAAAAYATANWILADPLTRSRWFLIPVQDLVSFAFWIAGFFGSTIVWRGRKYRLHSDGRIRPLTPP